MKIKAFRDLTTTELYKILKLRSEIFIVEQGGHYQDLDDIDYRSIHIFCEDENGSVIGCLRIFEKEDEPGTVQIGRVVSKTRLQGLGRQLMHCAEQTAKEKYHAKKLYLIGRESAYPFYLKCGYHAVEPKITTENGSCYKLCRILES